VPPVYLIYLCYRLSTESWDLNSNKMQQERAHTQELNQLKQLNQALIVMLAAQVATRDSITSPADSDSAAMKAWEAVESGTGPIGADPRVDGASG
jgi:hypothetical protein